MFIATKEIVLIHQGESKHLKIVNLLLDNGANIEIKNWYGYTPLLYMTEKSNFKLNEIIILMISIISVNYYRNHKCECCKVID